MIDVWHARAVVLTCKSHPDWHNQPILKLKPAPSRTFSTVTPGGADGGDGGVEGGAEGEEDDDPPAAAELEELAAPVQMCQL